MQVTVQPGHISGTIQANASKSAMQRACAAALLSNGTTIIHNPGISNDDKAALDIIRQLGATVLTLPNGSPLPVLLLANKCDLPESTVDKAQLDAFCTEHGFIGWIDTSAKTNHNVEEAVRRLVGDVLTHTEAFEAQKSAAAVAAAVPGQVKLAGLSPEPAAKKGCC